MLSNAKKEDLYKQGYRIVGNHSAIKVCTWTKKCLRDEDVCYKSTFYGINTHLCVQMTPVLQTCTHRCVWCWRDINHTSDKWEGPIDEPDDIIEGCINEHTHYLKGFWGNDKANKNKLSQKPKHFAISLSGEPTFYPKLPELIKKLHDRGITSFLVTNGTNPKMLKLLKKCEPTQLYVTLPAPNKRIYEKVCKPLIKYGWERILNSLEIASTFKRNVFRLTLTKGENMIEAKDYANLIKKFNPRWVEAKAYMWVGYSRLRMKNENMPLYDELKGFAQEISEDSGYPIIDEKSESRVVLLGKDSKDRIMNF